MKKGILVTLGVLGLLVLAVLIARLPVSPARALCGYPCRNRESRDAEYGRDVLVGLHVHLQRTGSPKVGGLRFPGFAALAYNQAGASP